MEWFTHGAAVAFRLYIHTFGSDAKAVPTRVGQFDGIERQFLSQGDIGPAIAVKRQTGRGILPEVVIRCFETSIRSHIRLENIR